MLNYYLGKRAADEGRTSPYPEVDFCKDPGAVCSNKDHPELKWVGEFRLSERNRIVNYLVPVLTVEVNFAPVHQQHRTYKSTTHFTPWQPACFTGFEVSKHTTVAIGITLTSLKLLYGAVWKMLRLLILFPVLSIG